ncbi:MAG: VTT domain-containing protein [archaeon]
MDINSLFSQLAIAGPIGVFFLSIITNATVFLPFPVLELALFASGPVDVFGLGIFSPLVFGVAAGAGAGIGELSGYFCGRGGRHILKKLKKEQAEKISGYAKKLEKEGFIALIIFAFLPLPFDLAGVAAGIVKFPIHLFMLGCAIGKIPRYSLIAYAGYFGISWVMSFFGG